MKAYWLQTKTLPSCLHCLTALQNNPTPLRVQLDHTFIITVEISPLKAFYQTKFTNAWNPFWSNFTDLLMISISFKNDLHWLSFLLVFHVVQKIIPPKNFPPIRDSLPQQKNWPLSVLSFLHVQLNKYIQSYWIMLPYSQTEPYHHEITVNFTASRLWS